MTNEITQEILERPNGISRASLMTYQEHRVIGSTTHEKYERQPYKPGAVIDGLLSAEDCDTLRQFGEDQGRLTSALVGYWKIPGYYGIATLEQLDLDSTSKSYGCTLSDPLLIEVFQERIMNLIPLEEFPYQRDAPRVNLKSEVD